MQDVDLSTAQSHAARIQAALEATLDRHAAGDDDARADALAGVLREQLRALPAAARADVVAALRALQPAAPPGAAPPDRAALEAMEALRAEVAALRGAPAGAPATPVARAPEGLARDVAGLLLGSRHDPDAFLAETPDAEARLLHLVRALFDFAESLGRVYLGATADADRTMAGRLAGSLGDALAADAGDAAAPLDVLKQRIGGQLVAFREACEVGARQLLRQLDPAAIEAEAAKGATAILGRKLFLERECWEAYQRRHAELRDAEQLYATFFDGAFRRALLRREPADPAREDA